MLFSSASDHSSESERHLLRDGAAALAVVLAINFIWTFYKTRKFYRNLPGPPHSWLFGHIPALLRASQRYPADIHPQLIINSLVDEYNLREAGAMYLDTFPVRSDSQMVITRGSIASQITVTHDMRKHRALKNIFGRVIGVKSLSILEKNQWKEVRGMFNAGFSASNIVSFLPAMLEEGDIFVSRLSTIAAAGGPRGGYTPSLMKLLKDLTADIIMRLTVGISTNCQKSPNRLIDMIAAASRYPLPASINPLEKFNVLRPIALIYYDWRTKKIIKKMVEERWDEIKSGRRGPPAAGQPKIMLDMALHKYHVELLKPGVVIGELDPEFLDIMCDNIKGFIFGGQDSTANALSWVLYILFQHPAIAAQIRAEHDAVFGPRPDAIGDVLRAKPHLINELPFTTACIKESMRIFAQSSSIRESDDFMTLRDPLTGHVLPTKDQLIFMPTHVLLRDTANFPNPDQYLPSRFLPNNANSQKIDTDAYRPFEKGLRSCIGQDMAMTEMKLILCLVVRKFNFEAAYEELNRRRGTNLVSVEREGGVAYPVLFTTAQPKDGMPMWVSENSDEN